jgi:hypothetical protein
MRKHGWRTPEWKLIRALEPPTITSSPGRALQPWWTIPRSFTTSRTSGRRLWQFYTKKMTRSSPSARQRPPHQPHVHQPQLAREPQLERPYASPSRPTTACTSAPSSSGLPQQKEVILRGAPSRGRRARGNGLRVRGAQDADKPEGVMRNAKSLRHRHGPHREQALPHL